MFKILKKISVEMTFIYTVVWIIIGIILLFFQAKNIKALLNGTINYDYLSTEDIQSIEGKVIVDATIDLNYGAFMEEYEKNRYTFKTKTLSNYYIILNFDDSDYRYMAIKLPEYYSEKMDAIEKDTYATLASEDTSSHNNYIQVSGVLRQMNRTELKYFKEFFSLSGFSSAEFDEQTIPYIIVEGELTGLYATIAWGLAGIGVLCIFIGVAIYIFALVGGNLARFKKDIRTSGHSFEEIEADFFKAQGLEQPASFTIGNIGTYITMTQKPRFIPNDKIVWVYKEVINKKRRGYKPETYYKLNIYTYNKKLFTYQTSSDFGIDNLLQYYTQQMPWIIVGYSDDIRNTFKKEYAKFLTYKYNHHKNSTP